MSNKYGITPLKRFFNLLNVDRQDIVSIYVYALFNGLVTLSLPLGIQAIINFISSGQVSTSWILLVILVIAGLAFNGILQIKQLMITESLQQKIFTRSAFEFAYRIPRISIKAIDNVYLPELTNRFFDTLSVQKGLSKILMDFSSASLQVVFGLILLSLYHPFFILFSFVLVAIVYFIFKFTAPQGLKTSLIESKYKYQVAYWLEELARTMETFKLAGKSPLPLNKTDEVVSDYLVSRKAHFKTLLIQYINLIGFKVIIVAGLLLIGGLLVINEQMNIGQFVASEIIIILILNSVEKLILSMETIYDVLTATEKIGNVTDIPLEKNQEGFCTPDNDQGLSIDIKSLSYRFMDANQNIIDDLNLNIESGEKICLSGFNGSGKSLLLQMLAGLFDNYQGAISYDNVPLGNWDKESLRSFIGDSLAKEEIFSGSLIENVSLGRHNVSHSEIKEMAQLVGLTEFIEELPEGYNTQLVSEGKNLPKSVRIKIMLARCLLSKPKLILLEDNFNMLQKDDINKILDFILDQNYTVIAVSNHEGIASKFDRSIILERGKIIAEGVLNSMKKHNWYTKVFQSN